MGHGVGAAEAGEEEAEHIVREAADAVLLAVVGAAPEPPGAADKAPAAARGTYLIPAAFSARSHRGHPWTLRSSPQPGGSGAAKQPRGGRRAVDFEHPAVVGLTAGGGAGEPIGGRFARVSIRDASLARVKWAGGLEENDGTEKRNGDTVLYRLNGKPRLDLFRHRVFSPHRRCLGDLQLQLRKCCCDKVSTIRKYKS